MLCTNIKGCQSNHMMIPFSTQHLLAFLFWWWTVKSWITVYRHIVVPSSVVLHLSCSSLMDRIPVRVPNPSDWCCPRPLNSQKRPVRLAGLWRAANNNSGLLEDKVTLRPCCAVLWPIPMWGTKNTTSDILSAPPRPCASLDSFLLLRCFAFSHHP